MWLRIGVFGILASFLLCLFTTEIAATTCPAEFAQLIEIDREVESFLDRFPYHPSPMTYPDAKTGEWKTMNFAQTRERWMEFIKALALVSYPAGEPVYIELEMNNRGRYRFRLQDKWVEGWRKLGLITPTNHFNLNIRPQEVEENFDRMAASFGFHTAVRFHRDSRGFDPSSVFARYLIGGYLPFDDLHAMFFHMPDILDPVRRRAFILAERFLILEEAVKKRSAESDTSKHALISFNIINGYFEGAYLAHGDTLSGFLNFFSPNTQDSSVTEGPSFKERQLFLQKLSQSKLVEIEAVLRREPVSLQYEDDSHWELMFYVMDVIASRWVELGLQAEGLEDFIGDVRKARSN
ncbi:MAG: hypothetical protein COV44_09155 [Deltaproteobacteria bacterium CG11_big_fil_rev_8_21_14_0_20_45_16]|nr:MAG: hypothetical protein COV44_09155 [Deltaproteobacteria bacterium CG11_big_fil_rev_8_21_14_0_20_45_16]